MFIQTESLFTGDVGSISRFFLITFVFHRHKYFGLITLLLYIYLISFYFVSDSFVGCHYVKDLV
jgi:hypothetical protein